MDALWADVLWIFNVGGLGVWIAGLRCAVDFLVVGLVDLCL